MEFKFRKFTKMDPISNKHLKKLPLDILEATDFVTLGNFYN
jgi:hypothetical protein